MIHFCKLAQSSLSGLAWCSNEASGTVEKSLPLTVLGAWFNFCTHTHTRKPLLSTKTLTCRMGLRNPAIKGCGSNSFTPVLCLTTPHGGVLGVIDTHWKKPCCHASSHGRSSLVHKDLQKSSYFMIREFGLNICWPKY